MANEKGQTQADMKLKPEAPEDEKSRLAQEVNSLRAQLDIAQRKLVQSGVSEDLNPLIREKVMMGLSLEDATQCAKRQVLHNRIMAGIEAEAIVAGKAAREAMKAEAKADNEPMPKREELLQAQKTATMEVYNEHRAELVDAAK